MPMSSPHITRILGFFFIAATFSAMDQLLLDLRCLSVVEIQGGPNVTQTIELKDCCCPESVSVLLKTTVTF
jgi:hypothetical protein